MWWNNSQRARGFAFTLAGFSPVHSRETTVTCSSGITYTPYFLDQNPWVILVSAFQNSGRTRGWLEFKGDFYYCTVVVIHCSIGWWYTGGLLVVYWWATGGLLVVFPA